MNTKEKMEMFAGYRRELALDLNLEVPTSDLFDISDDVKNEAFEKASVSEYRGQIGGKEVGVFVLIGNSPIVAKSKDLPAVSKWPVEKVIPQFESAGFKKV